MGGQGHFRRHPCEFAEHSRPAVCWPIPAVPARRGGGNCIRKRKKPIQLLLPRKRFSRRRTQPHRSNFIHGNLQLNVRRTESHWAFVMVPPLQGVLWVDPKTRTSPPVVWRPLFPFLKGVPLESTAHTMEGIFPWLEKYPILQKTRITVWGGRLYSTWLIQGIPWRDPAVRRSDARVSPSGAERSPSATEARGWEVGLTPPCPKPLDPTFWVSRFSHVYSRFQRMNLVSGKSFHSLESLFAPFFL